MNISLVLAAVTALATTAGGLLALKSRDRLHIVLGLAAGLLLGLVAFDLLPEVFELNTTEINHVPAVSLALLAGFILLHLFERALGSHEPLESEYASDHKHSHNLAGTIGALAISGHVFLDGVALGVALQVSDSLGFAIFARPKIILFKIFLKCLNKRKGLIDSPLRIYTAIMYAKW